MNCPNCSTINTKIVYTNNNMPYGINLKNTTINLKVSLCQDCKFVFQSSAYIKDYDEVIKKLYTSYKISNMYNFPNKNIQNIKALDFISSTIENSVDYNVLEIGSNRGDFLYLLKEKFSNINILGCEPTEFKNLKVPTINSFFDKNLFNTKFDLIILRHTLEHIKNPKQFMKDVQNTLKQDGYIFIEVPNIYYSLKNFIEDFTPDHVNYFSLNSLVNCCEDLALYKFDDTQYLYTIFTNRKSDVVTKHNSIDFEELFVKLSEQINKISKELKIFEKIVFYGVGNYYLWFFSRYKDILQNKSLFVFDDFVQKDEIFGIKKLDSLENISKDDLVVVCSSNQDIQKKIEIQLKNKTNILMPFKDIKYV